jgi:hypothetical protein
MFVNKVFYCLVFEIDYRAYKTQIGLDVIIQHILWGSFFISLIRVFQYNTIIMLFYFISKPKKKMSKDISFFM